MFLYFKMEGTVFQVDCKQILDVRVISPGTTENEKQTKEKNSNDTTAKMLPPCLILVFPCCLFRIFPFSANVEGSVAAMVAEASSDSDATTMKESFAGAVQALSKLEAVLGQLISNAFESSAGMVAAWSPSSSAPTSSGEPGQYPQPYGHHGGTLASSGSSSTVKAHHHSSSKKAKWNNNNDDDDIGSTIAAAKAMLEDNHLVRKMKRRRDALVRSLAGLTSVETILDMPLSVYAPDHVVQEHPLVPSSLRTKRTASTKEGIFSLSDSAVSDGGATMPKTQGQQGPSVLLDSQATQMTNASVGGGKVSTSAMGPLMAGITEDFTVAYGTIEETHEALNLYQQAVDRLHGQHLDKVLDSFFPSMPQKKDRWGRSRTPSRSRTSTCSRSDSKSVPIEEAMESVRLLMNEQRMLVQDRSALYKLPTRG